MQFMFWIGARGQQDTRITLFRFETGDYISGQGWKFSISLHPRLFYWRRYYREIRVTLLGLNIHWRGK